MGQIRRSVPITSRQVMAAGSADPHYVAMKLSSGLISAVQIIWHDDVSNFTVTPYTSLMDKPTIPASAVAAPTLEHWHDESADISITGPTAVGVGCDVVHIGNNGAKWLLLRFTLTAASIVTVLVHGKE